jgi:hypothetical protein
LPRVKQIIKRLGSTCTIAMYYAPIIIYIYSYVIKDYVRGNPDSSLTK